ncbi:hypothetical protein HRbin32_01421 [bacterium HR32]|nr:hypothetical protein HRbin32_01421 [bacterium HR32]
MTGITSSTIHSGRFPLLRKASTTSRRLRILIRFCPLLPRSSARRRLDSSSRSSSMRSSLTASAPMPARKRPPDFSRSSRYSFSVRICFFCSSFTSPGSMTM